MIHALLLTFVFAAEPGDPLGTKGKQTVADDFSQTDVSDVWRTSQGNKVVNGVLQCEQTNPRHPAVSRRKVEFKDAIIECKFRFRGGNLFSMVFDDKLTAPTTHSGHLCRCSIGPEVIRVSDDREGGMNLKILPLKNSEDPKDREEFERLTKDRKAETKIKLEQDRWYTLRIELVGDEMQASIDGKPLVRLKSPGFDHPINREFGPTVSGKYIDFDDLKIWEVAK